MAAACEEAISKLSIADHVPTDDELRNIVAFLEPAEVSRELFIRLAQLVGDLARQDDPREKLGAAGAVPAIARRFASSGDLNEQKLAARAISNLCYEHKDNRAKAATAGVIPRGVALLSQTADADLQRNLCGLLANLASASEENCTQIVKEGGDRALLAVVAAVPPPSVVTRGMSYKALANLCESEAHAQHAVSEGLLEALFRLLSGDDEEEDDLRQEANSLLADLAEFDSVRPEFAKRDLTRKLLARFAALPAATDAESRSKSLKCLSALSLDDDSMHVLYGQLPLCLSLLRTDVVDDFIPAAMIFGNLARTDEHCLAIGAQGGIPLLLDLIRKHEDVRVLHLLLGSLRNLCLPTANKERALAAGVFDLLPPLLCHKSGHVQYGSVGVTKALIAAGEQYVRDFFAKPELLQGIIKVSTPDPNVIMDGGERIYFEGARCLAQLAIRGNDQELRLLAEADGAVGVLVRLAEARFPLLQQEAAQAFLRLCQCDIGRRAALKGQAVPALATLCSGAADNAPLQAVALAALDKLLEADVSRLEVRANQEWTAALQKLTVAEANAASLAKVLARLQ